jgi:hypothetical protein
MLCNSYTYPNRDLNLGSADTVGGGMPRSNDFRAHSNPIPRPGGEFAPVFGANFPVQLTTLVGRGPEVASALQMMRRPEVRLLTFTGPGGVGKTRLALRVAEDLVGEYEDGVYLVSLAPVRDPELVVPAIGRTLGITEVGEKPVGRDFTSPASTSTRYPR